MTKNGDPTSSLRLLSGARLSQTIYSVILHQTLEFVYLEPAFPVNLWNQSLRKISYVLYIEFQCNYILNLVVHMGLS